MFHFRPTWYILVQITMKQTHVKWRLDKGQIEVVDDAVARVLRGKTPAQRVEMALAANRLVRLRIEGHLRTRHGDWDAARIQAEIARRMLLGSD
jgi:hypothetical protein